MYSSPKYYNKIISNKNYGTIVRDFVEFSVIPKNVKVIINTRNFGHIRSPIYGMLQSSGDACILMSSDFQDPISLISEYIKEWEKGSKIVLGQRITSDANLLLNFLY